MFHRWRGQPHKSLLRVLVFHYTAVLLLTHCCEGGSQMVGPSKPILAMVGDDVILPCYLNPAIDVVAKTLEWARPDLNPRFVLVRRDGVELLVNQNPSYMGRTSLSTDKLKRGDVSLKLSKVKLSDGGTYRCYIHALGTSSVELVVGALSSPVVIIADIDKETSSVALHCESKGWYPEPEVLWLDGEGNLLSAGPAETVRGPDDLYTVSSRVTVEKRHSNRFTCRVQQKDINQTRETEIRILDDVFAAPTCSAVRITVVLSASLLLILFPLVFVCWNQRQNMRCIKLDHNTEAEDGAGETEQNLESQEEEEEIKNLNNVISLLMERKDELEISKNEHISQLEEAEKDFKKKEKKMKSSDKTFPWNKDDKRNSLSKTKEEQEKRKTELKKSLQSIVERKQKTEDAIKKMTERKMKVENHIDEINNLRRQREKDEIQAN